MHRKQKIKEEKDIWEGNSGQIRRAIINILKNSNTPIQMNELFRGFKNILRSRGSLRYHLDILIKYNYIHPIKRDNTQRGRPTYIKINQEKIQQLENKEKKFMEDFDNKVKQAEEKYKTAPIIKEILKLLLKKDYDNSFNLDETIKKNLKLDIYSSIIVSLKWLIINGYVKETYSITPKGKKFLAEQSKKKKDNK